MLGKTLGKVENCVNVLILTLENLLLAVLGTKDNSISVYFKQRPCIPGLAKKKTFDA